MYIQYVKKVLYLQHRRLIIKIKKILYEYLFSKLPVQRKLLINLSYVYIQYLEKFFNFQTKWRIPFSKYVTKLYCKVYQISFSGIQYNILRKIYIKLQTVWKYSGLLVALHFKQFGTSYNHIIFFLLVHVANRIEHF